MQRAGEVAFVYMLLLSLQLVCICFSSPPNIFLLCASKACHVESLFIPYPSQDGGVKWLLREASLKTGKREEGEWVISFCGTLGADRCAPPWAAMVLHAKCRELEWPSWPNRSSLLDQEHGGSASFQSPALPLLSMDRRGRRQGREIHSRVCSACAGVGEVSGLCPRLPPFRVG